MVTAETVRDYIDTFAPYDVFLVPDNIGLSINPIPNNPVTKIMVALDPTMDVIEEAADFGAQLIVSHHPVIFDPIKDISGNDPIGKRVIALVQNNIASIAIHTNLDLSKNGVCDTMLRILGAENKGFLKPMGIDKWGNQWGLTRIGELPAPMPMEEYLPFVKKAFKVNGLRYHDSGRPVHRIACAGGRICDPEAVLAYKMGCDTYVAADIGYDDFTFAKDCGMNIIDADHFCTENIIVPYIYEKLAEHFTDIEIKISETHVQTAQFFV